MYETVWTRQLAYAFSSTAVTSCLVLASFMGGMAIGSWLSGRLSARVRSPLTVYAYLELGLALCGCAYPDVIDRVGRLYLSFARGAAAGPGLFAARFGMFAALLTVPAMLMGATLPLVVQLVAGRRERAGRGLSLLYAVNSAGGVAGCLLAGFVTVETIGLALSSDLAAAANVIAALTALATRRLVDNVAEPAPDANPPPAPGLPPPASSLPSALPLVLAVSGFTAMAYEVLWARTLPLVLGSSTYSFALMLTMFVSGVTLGSAAYRALAGRLDPLRTVALAQVGIGAWVLVTMPLYRWLPWPFVFVRSALDASFAAFQAVALALNGAVMFVPAFLFGLGFPAAVDARARAGGAVGRAVGDLYAANTAGNVAGSLVTGLWLIPRAGTPVAFQLCAVANLLTGLALAPRELTSLPRRTRLGLAALFLALVIWPGSRGWLEPLAMGGFSRMRWQNWPEAKKHLLSQEQQSVAFFEEDPTCAVLVSERHGERALWVNGKVDASSTGDMGTQILLALLPLAMHEDPHRVFVLGLGSGVTTGAALLDRRVQSVEACEISPGVVHASKFFEDVNFHWQQDRRARAYVDDGRHFLATRDAKYDVITMEPSNPWMAGITGLYTREFLELARAHLAPGGLMMQWTHFYEIDPDSLHLITRTFQDAFPHVRAFRSSWDLMMVGAERAELLEPARLVKLMTQRVQDPGIAKALADQGYDSPFTLFSSEIFDAGALSRWTGAGAVLTDDHPDLEFTAPVAYYTGNHVTPPVEHLPLSGSLLAAYLNGRAPTRQELAGWARFRLRAKQVVGLPRALKLMGGDDPELAFLSAKAYLMATQPDSALQCAKLASDARPDDLEMARTYYQAARSAEDEEVACVKPRTWTESRAALARLARLDSKSPRLNVDAAEVALLAHDGAAAERALTALTAALRAHTPGLEGEAGSAATMWMALARDHDAAGRSAAARAAASTALELDPASAAAREFLATSGVP